MASERFTAWPAALLLDLDGTLLDTLSGLTAALNAVPGELRRPCATPRDVRSWVGNGVHTLLHRALTRVHHERAADAFFKPALELCAHHYGALREAHCLPYPGVVPLLRASRDAGIGRACVTNKPADDAHALLRATGIGGYFDAVVGGDRTAHIKPHPAPLCAALPRVQRPHAHAPMVGDSDGTYAPPAPQASRW